MCDLRNHSCPVGLCKDSSAIYERWFMMHLSACYYWGLILSVCRKLHSLTFTLFDFPISGGDLPKVSKLVNSSSPLKQDANHAP